MFGSVWILHLNVLEFEFYPLYFRGVWILLPKVWGVWILHPKVS